MDDFPLTLSSLETIRLPNEHWRDVRSILSDDAPLLHRTQNAHVTIYECICSQYFNNEGTQLTECAVELLKSGFDASRGKRGNIEPDRIIGPIFCALCSRHRFAHLFENRN